jgi:hypothetical protein
MSFCLMTQFYLPGFTLFPFPVNLSQPFLTPDSALLFVDDTLSHYIKGYITLLELF